MARLIRLDRTGHTELAAVDDGRPDLVRAGRRGVPKEQLAGGYMGVAKLADDSDEQVKELPADADLVMLRRPIAGG